MKLLTKIFKIMYTLLFFLVLISAGFVILTSYKVVEGYNFYVVMSGSMEPNVRMGSVVGVKQEANYNEGDIVTVIMQDGTNKTYTHRLVNKEVVENVEMYTTKGDANETNDVDKITKGDVLGKVFLQIPLLGYLLNYAKQPAGFILMIIVPSIIIVSSELNTIRDALAMYIKNKQEAADSLLKK